MALEANRKKSLEQLDAQHWGETIFDSHLVAECHRLRRIPLCEFTVEDLRIMIGQHIGMEYLIPMALEQLPLDPLTEGDYYPGDLLASVLRAGREFWRRYPTLGNEVATIAAGAASSFLDDEALKEAYQLFERDRT